jgi:hypothetical protein
LSGKKKEKDLLEDLTIDVRKIVTWILKKNRVGWC